MMVNMTAEQSYLMNECVDMAFSRWAQECHYMYDCSLQTVKLLTVFTS